MRDERRKIINEISYLESTYCMNCPRLNKTTNQNNKERCRKQRNNIQCVGCTVYDAIRERGNELEIVAQKDTFKKVRERYLNNPYEYLQHKEYPIELIIKELDITKYELRRRNKQTN
ncbi:transposase [Bacillus sp. AFS098217]|nr:transposase [Bacillus sp. AFS098217]